MTARTSRWTTDLLVVLLATVLATGAVLVGVDESLLRTAVLAPFVLFLPGYALVSALFPERYDRTKSSDWGPVSAPGVAGAGISPPARIGLSVAISIALLPAMVLALDFAVGGLRIETAFLLLAALTVVLTLTALFRRRNVPGDARFVLPTTTRLVAALGRPFGVQDPAISRSSTIRPTSKRGLLLNVVLAVSVLSLLGSVAVAYAYPTQDEQFTELYLVTQSEDGEYVAADYPHSFEEGQSRPVYVTVGNHEGETQAYTLVATLQEVEGSGNETTVTAERELRRFSRTVAADETVRIRHDLRPSEGSGRMRVEYLLYRGEPPANPSTETAYRSVHLWIAVGGDADADAAEGI